MKHLLLICCLLFGLNLAAQQTASSYIYLEGIKTIPFKLKVNGKEITQRNKMYYLIPIQESGEHVMEIIFAGDLYPTQQFILDANLSSAFGYKLAKTIENKFYLVDLVNKGKIIETNSDINIGLSTIENTINFSNTLVINDKQHKPEKVKKLKKNENTNSTSKNDSRNSVEPKTDVVKVKKNKPKKEISVEIVKPIEQEKPEKENPIVKEETRKLRTNTCNAQSSEQEVLVLIGKMKTKTKDEDRMLVLRKKVFNGCISCSQLYRISEIFYSQRDRLEAVRFLRNLISDTENNNSLDNLFKSESSKVRCKNFFYE